jgi:hypothetical protein
MNVVKERSQSEKSTYSMIQILWYAGKDKILETFFICKGLWLTRLLGMWEGLHWQNTREVLEKWYYCVKCYNDGCMTYVLVNPVEICNMKNKAWCMKI